MMLSIKNLSYQFSDSTFGEIHIHLLDVIEHLPDTIAVMEEIYRICRPNAKVFIRVVNWNHRYTAMDPTHVKAFTKNSFDYFGKRGGRSYYTHARFDVEHIDYIFDKKARRLFKSERIMRFLSDYLCNILQGMIFELRVVK